MEPVPCTVVSVNRRNNEVRVHIATWAWASLFRRFTDTNVLYGTNFIKYGYVDILQCGLIFIGTFNCKSSSTLLQ